MKTLEHVGTEMALHVLACNMKQAIRILGAGFDRSDPSMKSALPIGPRPSNQNRIFYVAQS